MNRFLFFSLLAALCFPSHAFAQSATATEVAERLGLSQTAIQRIERGQVVAEELEASSDKDLALVVIGRLDVPLATVFDFVSADRMAEFQTVTISRGPIEPSNPSLAEMQLPDDVLEQLARDPGGTFNLSDGESERMSEAAGQGKAQILDAYRAILADRARAYWETGISGITPYSGKGRSPAVDLAVANKAAESLVKNVTFQTEIEAVPARSPGKAEHRLFWAVEKGRDQAAPVLIHRILYKQENAQVFLDRRFYSGYDYDALQIVVGILPISAQTSVAVYTNHTYTAQVAGFGGGAKRSIGRKLLERQLVAEMQRAQKVISGER